MWYKKLPTPRPRADRLRYSLAGGKSKGIRARKQMSRREPASVFHRKFCQSLYINGQRVKIVTRYLMSQFFGVPISTIITWDRLGILPEPFMWLDRGVVKYPVYLSSQFRCLVIVVNDMIAANYVSIPWARMPDHVAMLKAGYEESMYNFQKRSGHFDEEFVDEDERPGKFGVQFVD